MLALAVLAVVAIVLASLAVAGLLPSRRSDGGKGGGTVRAADAPLPRSGTGIEVGTADGARYRIAAVTGGVGGPPETSSQSPPSRTAFAYVEYILTNPTKGRVLLDFPGDVFVRRALVTPRARGRCMPQAGVPENLCTPPTTSEVVRRLAGGELIPGNGGARYMPPGASYLVRATVDVPVARALTRKDMRLYVWRQLYMADRLAEQAPFPR
ncbi:hypothetical protein AGRA3207_005343 [Actinomadura graeca]|uniref:Uncharacterized protein n=1 Tax=Actinomadura graeca TaxID=2750812 RepID=A0ABX8QZ59_9ACTN|nr:hypothetical protein [Actinomadura graeca]QXJ24090.1 hypothetical protein AGRA3207_005343 [Actinomadura graeca]